MCKLTKDGYLTNDGTLIPFHKLNIEDIDLKHINELSNSKASLWDVLVIRNSIHNQGEVIQRAIFDQTLRFESAMEKHTKDCRICELDEVIEKKILEAPEEKAKERFEKFKRVSGYISLIISLITLLLIVLEKMNFSQSVLH